VTAPENPVSGDHGPAPAGRLHAATRLLYRRGWIIAVALLATCLPALIDIPALLGGHLIALAVLAGAGMVAGVAGLISHGQRQDQRRYKALAIAEAAAARARAQETGGEVTS
jgi:hypothetical protein